jgi:hypothetical protein
MGDPTLQAGKQNGHDSFGRKNARGKPWKIRGELRSRWPAGRVLDGKISLGPVDPMRCQRLRQQESDG